MKAVRAWDCAAVKGGLSAARTGGVKIPALSKAGVRAWEVAGA